MSRTTLAAITSLLFAWWLTAPHVALAQAAWSQQVGGPGTGEVTSLAIDGAGAVYCVGTINDSVRTAFGKLQVRSGNHPYSKPTDAYLMKYTASGQPLWMKQLGESINIAESKEVAVDGSGNVLWLGQFHYARTITIGSTVLSSQNSRGGSFLAKYSPQGQLLWARMVSIGGDDYKKMCIDAAGAIYLAGPYYGNSAIVKIDSQGTTVWEAPLTYGANNAGVGACTVMGVDANNQLWVGAYGYAVVSGGGGGVRGLFSLSRYTLQGTLIGNNTTATAIENGGICFGPTGITYLIYHNVIEAYNLQGTMLWSKTIDSRTASTSYQRPSISTGFLGSDGNFYLTGYFWGNPRIGNSVLSGPSSQSLGHGFVAVLDNQGVALNAVSTGTSQGNALAPGLQQRLYLAGRFSGVSGWAGTRLTSRSTADGFIALLGTSPLAAHSAALSAATFLVSPCPATLADGLRITVLKPSATEFYLYSVLGKLVAHQSIPASTRYYRMPIQHITPGTYLLLARNSSGVQTQRIVLQ